MARPLALVLAAAALLGPEGCSCSRLEGEVDGLEFTRCAQGDAPEERSLHTAALELDVHERLVTIKPRAALRIAAFTGPVGAPLSRTDLALLTAAAPSLVLYLGGLGDDQAAITANVTALSALHVPVIFVAGGADRVASVNEALDDLDDEVAQWFVQASGARELRIGKERFAIVAGAPLGRYSIDESACGFVEDDLDDVESALASADVKGARRYLLSWAAPSGFGLTQGAGGADIGSPELAELAKTLAVKGGLFAYPESRAFTPSRDAKRGGLALTVPRLGRTGSLRADGGLVPRALALLTVQDDGLTLVP